MKVFVYSPTAPNSIGSIIITANTETEGREILKKADTIDSAYDGTELYGVTATGKPRVLHEM